MIPSIPADHTKPPMQLCMTVTMGPLAIGVVMTLGKLLPSNSTAPSFHLHSHQLKHNGSKLTEPYFSGKLLFAKWDRKVPKSPKNRLFR